MPALVVFGDSWANSADHIHTWPEMLATRWGRTLINLAMPHSGSDQLHVQQRDLCLLLSDRCLGEDDLAIIHTGGNDLYFSQPSSLAALALSGPFAGLFASQIGRSLSANVQDLVQGLIKLGVRHIACVGVPLSTKMPFIAKPVAELGAARLALCLARCVMRSSNRALLTAMHAGVADAQRASGINLHTAHCIDEARAIERVIDADPTRDEDTWWEDASHPSQALHTALADVLQVELAHALDAARSSLAPQLAQKGPARDDGATFARFSSVVDDGDVRVSLLPTPKEREAISQADGE